MTKRQLLVVAVVALTLLVGITNAAPRKLTNADKSAKVLVVGAGPAGLHTAKILAEQGFTDITVWERTNRVGGKSYTIYMTEDGRECKHGTQGCVAHEMGTCFLHSGYHGVRELYTELGLRHETPPIGRAIFSPELFQKQTQGKTLTNTRADYDMSGEMAELVGAEITALYRKAGKPDPTPKQVGLELLQAMGRYSALHHKYFGEIRPLSFPVKKQFTKAEWDFLAQPAGKTLKDHDMEQLMGFLSIGQAAQGYGYLPEVPTLYLMWWMSPELLHSFAQQAIHTGTTSLSKIVRGARWINENFGLWVAKTLTAFFVGWQGEAIEWTTTMLPDGYQNIWDVLANKLVKEKKIKLEYNRYVTKVDRKIQDPDAPVEVHYTTDPKYATRQLTGGGSPPRTAASDPVGRRRRQQQKRQAKQSAVKKPNGGGGGGGGSSSKRVLQRQNAFRHKKMMMMVETDASKMTAKATTSKSPKNKKDSSPRKRGGGGRKPNARGSSTSGQMETFKYVFYTGPLKSAFGTANKKVFVDVTPEEKSCFGRLHQTSLSTTIYQGLPVRAYTDGCSEEGRKNNPDAMCKPISYIVDNMKDSSDDSKWYADRKDHEAYKAVKNDGGPLQLVNPKAKPQVEPGHELRVGYQYEYGNQQGLELDRVPPFNKRAKLATQLYRDVQKRHDMTAVRGKKGVHPNAQTETAAQIRRQRAIKRNGVVPPHAPLGPKPPKQSPNKLRRTKAIHRGSGGALIETEATEVAIKDIKVPANHNHGQFSWPYFAHYHADGVRAGCPSKIWEMQGKHKVYTLGASASFESVEDQIRMNCQLMAEILPNFECTFVKRYDTCWQEKVKHKVQAAGQAVKGFLANIKRKCFGATATIDWNENEVCVVPDEKDPNQEIVVVKKGAKCPSAKDVPDDKASSSSSSGQQSKQQSKEQLKAIPPLIKKKSSKNRKDRL